MVIHDYECTECGNVFETLVDANDKTFKECPDCSGPSYRVYLKATTTNGDSMPDYVREAIPVVDKDGGKHCQEFLRSPNKRTFNEWMKGEGLRKVERGEKLSKHRNTAVEKQARKEKRVRELLKRKQKREAITTGG